MSFAKSGMIAALALAGVVANANTVEMVVDVTANTRKVGHLIDGVVQEAVDPVFSPQTFTYTVRFDLEDAEINSPQSSNLGFSLYASGFFYGGAGASSSETPFTPAIALLLPSQQTATWKQFTQVHYALTASSYDGPNSVWASVGFGTSSMWQSVDAQRAITTSYGRNIGWDNELVGSTYPGNFKAWSGEEFVSYLQSHVGDTFARTFTEAYFQSVRKTELWGDQLVISGADDALLSQDTIRISGDFTVRSVSVIPEPTETTLLIAGALLIGGQVVARRRRT